MTTPTPTPASDRVAPEIGVLSVAVQRSQARDDTGRVFTMAAVAARRRSLSDALLRLLVQSFTGLGSWRAGDRDRWVAQVVPYVQGAQRAIGDLVAATLAEDATVALGEPVGTPVIPTAAVTDLRGVHTAEVYARPFTELYTALSHGDPLPAAVSKGANRARQIGEMDLQQAYSAANHEGMTNLPPGKQPTGWRRVLVGEVNCAMCAIASTQRYHRKDLNPIHPACDCAVAPLWTDTGQVIDPALLEEVHDAVEALTGTVDRGARDPDYRELITRRHGELGPLLVNPRDHFTGPQAIPD